MYKQRKQYCTQSHHHPSINSGNLRSLDAIFHSGEIPIFRQIERTKNILGSFRDGRNIQQQNTHVICLQALPLTSMQTADFYCTLAVSS